MLNLFVTSLMPYMKFAALVMPLLPSRYKHWDLSVLSTGSLAFLPRHEIPGSESQGFGGSQFDMQRVRSMGDLSLVLFSTFLPFSLSFHTCQESQWTFLVSLSSNLLCFGGSLVMLITCLLWRTGV